MLREALGTAHVWIADSGRHVDAAVNDADHFLDESGSLFIGQFGDLASDGWHDTA